MRMLTVAILGACALSAFAQQPNAPQPKSPFSATDYSSTAGVIAGRAADWASTKECVRRPNCKEVLLPNALVRNKAGFAAYELGAASGLLYVQYRLTRSGHRALARIIAGSNISLDGFVSAHNYRVGAK